MLFNEMLMKRRRELGMTQDELAEKLDISRQSISRWENGECMPDADKLIRLSDILDVSLDELTGREVKVAPIILEAPKIPRKKKTPPKKILIAAAILAAVGAICFLAGRYFGGRGNDLPEALTAYDFSFDSFNDDGVFELSFVSNAMSAGEISFYPAVGSGERVSVRTVCKNGTHMAKLQLAPGARYDKAVFTCRAKGVERKMVLLTDVLVDWDCGVSYNDLCIKGSYRTFVTRDYTAVLPENSAAGVIVGFDGSENACVSELLETVSYPSDEFIVPFDREKTVAEMYEYLLEKEPGLNTNEAARLAEALADRIEQIHEALKNDDTDGLTYHYTEDGALVIDIGSIVDGALTDTEH